MKSKFIFISICIIASQAKAQIKYSSKIPKQQLSVLTELEKTLQNTSFTLPGVISDTAKFSYADSVKYAAIFNSYFDTTQIKLLKERQVGYINKEQEEGWLRGMTISSLIAIHNLIHCVPDSIFFVMPASEYNFIDNEDEGFKDPANRLLVAGFKSGEFYYPYISILFSVSNKKIVYMNFLVNFGGDTEIKKSNFERKLKNVIAPCVRLFSESYGSQNGNSL